MIRRSRAKSSSLFLMELILAILFFSITSAVCIQFFVKSHLLSKESKALSQAVTECSNIAEIASVSDSAKEAISTLRDRYPNLQEGNDSLVMLYYDDAFSPCEKEKAAYSLAASFSEENSMLNASMNVTGPDGSVIYELNAGSHIPRRTDYER